METTAERIKRLENELRHATKRSAYWCNELAEADKDIKKLEAVATNLVDDIAGLKGRKDKDLARAVSSGNSWFSVIRARKLIGKETV